MARYNKKHGLSDNKLYGVWNSMKYRCYNKNAHNYCNYGGRGIKICKQWIDNFLNFYEWAISNGYKEGLTIDRIDNDGDYCPSNCRFTTVLRQSNNTRRNFLITYKNETLSATEWARKIGVSPDAIKWRLKKYGLCEKVFYPCNTIFRNRKYVGLWNTKRN